MTTSEFIEMLKDADPSGNAHVRLPNGGVPYYAEHKAGYWDGAYSYINDKDEYVTTINGTKVDIGVIEYDDVVWELNGDMEKIKKKFKFEFDGYCNENHRNAKEQSHWSEIEMWAKWARDRDLKFLDDWYKEVVETFYDDSWEIRQPLDEPIGRYNCMKAHKLFSKPRQLNQGQCEILIRSGKFYPKKEKKYYIWKHDPEKGSDWSMS